jgi:hypothetical protein
MGKNLVLALVTIAVILVFVFNDCAFGEISVGVKPGDWIEYNAVTYGNPPEEHNVTWARLEILQVQGLEVRVNVTTQARDGSLSNRTMTLNPQTGQIGAWWIIPANLNPGETFYDDFLKQNITIDGEEQLEYAGAARTITNATVPSRTKQWDKATGIFVLSVDDYPDYGINVRAYATNMWSGQILGLDPVYFYGVLIAVVLLAAFVPIVLILARRRRQNGR